LLGTLIGWLRTSPPAPQLTDTEEVDRLYRYWRKRILYSSFIAYAVFYLCRVNISMAIPAMEESLGYTKTQLGIIVSLLQIAYGLGKFGNGILADRTNPRYFMALGLLLSGLCNILFGLQTGLVVLAGIWLFNGWFQSMGFPPAARLLSHWFSPSEHGRVFSVYGCSHQVGAAIVLVAAGYIVEYQWPTGEAWQYVFFLPGAFALITALILLERLRDIPSSMGLPQVERHRGDIRDEEKLEAAEQQFSIPQTLRYNVLNNKYVWFVGLGNFFLYVARYGALTWAPSYISQAKDVSIVKAGMITAFFEIMGILGMLTAGWISDHLFGARRGPVMAIYMFFLSFSLYLFWVSPPGQPLLYTVLLGISGFLVYGPLMLVSVAAINFSGKKAAATAAGFTGLLGYIGATLSGVGIGWAAQNFGWSVGFSVVLGAGIMSSLFFALTWKISPRFLDDPKAP
jgi:glycerol-3-phosphate transporter